MSDELRLAILDRIDASGGRISFAEYMELALYHPKGFFGAAPVGRGAHFVTSPHVSPVFARLISEQVRETAAIVGETCTVVDLGAGDGLLAHRIAREVPGVRVVAVERAQPPTPGPDVIYARSLQEVGPFVGLVVANELLDNIPFHRLRRAEDGSIVEVFVGRDGDLLVETEGPPVVQSDPIEGAREWPVSPAVEQVVRDLAASLRAGHVLFFDYGFTAGEQVEPIRGYRGHRMVQDLLEDPGSTDITGPVNFDALASLARAHGFEAHGPVTQREALTSLGYRKVLQDLRREQAAREADGEHRRAIELFGARNEAAMLVEPTGLGSLHVLGLSTPGVPPPRPLS